ncbi:glycosyltransferase [Schleiferiaceae bacterium]|nr:glycosyltransferase [Schleiferiaceae bacterium]
MFYSEIHKLQFEIGGHTYANALVANNTVGIDSYRKLSTIRNNEFCFIGSLNARKRLDILFRVVSVLKARGILFKCRIIGDGPEEMSLRDLANSLNIDSNIIWHGRLESDSQIASVIEKCRFSVSVGQAGLSVLHSMAFGTPFLTLENAISGGETFNIVNGLNGFKCHNEAELIDRMEEMLLGNHDDMFAVAQKYYISNASKENWLHVVEEALKISTELA